MKIKLLILPILLLASSAQAQNYNINDIIIEGNKRVDTGALRELIQSKSPIVKSETISQDLRELYLTGYFDDATASLIDRNENGLNKKYLKFSLTEKPIVRKLLIKGNKEVDEEDLAKVIKLGSSKFLDRAQILNLTKAALTFYQSQGFYDATIDYSVVPVENGLVDLSFNVVEGESFKIRRIDFIGIDENSEIDAADIRSEMQTKRYKWWNSWLFSTGRLNQEMLDNDKNIVRQYFLDHGYVDASISEPNIEKKDDGLYLSFYVKQGNLYKFGSISAQGDLIENSVEKTLAETSIETEKIFNASKLREDTFKISEKFTDIGYAYANVVPKTAVDRERQKVDISYEIDKGNIVTINRINISGNDKTYDNVIRREMKIDEQETFSSIKIRKSQEKLQRLGYFEEVNISTEQPESDLTKIKDQNDKRADATVNDLKSDLVDLNVNVREASTGSLSAGAGYSSGDGALFNARISENNLFGWGKRISLDLDIGSRRENKIISYDDPRFNDTKWAMSIDLEDTQREFNDFDRRETGGALSFGYPLEEFWSWAEDTLFYIKYEYLKIKIDNVDITDAAPLVIRAQGTSDSSGITPRLVRSTINNPLNPSKGSKQDLSLELTGLGGTERYYLLNLKNQWYRPVTDVGAGKLVFSWRTKFGYGKSYDGSELPLFRRFFPGGINSVRGFDERKLGPKDADGNEFGGNQQFVNNFEFIFPLVESAGLRGVVFVDSGQAFDESNNINISDLRHAYGMGLRWTSPLGPIRIEFGFPIAKEEGENSMVTLFSFGAPL